LPPNALEDNVVLYKTLPAAQRLDIVGRKAGYGVKEKVASHAGTRCG